MYAQLSLVISVIALALSGFATFRQLNHTRSTSEMKMVLDVALHNIRDKDFQNDQRYVLTQLALDHDPGQGIDALPEPARSMVRNVAFTYDYIGMISTLKMVDPRIVVAVFHFRTVRAWKALEVYIRRERALRQAPVCPFFENLVAQIGDKPVEEVLRSLKVRYSPETTTMN